MLHIHQFFAISNNLLNGLHATINISRPIIETVIVLVDDSAALAGNCV